MPSDVQGPVPADDPLMIAWNAFKTNYEFANAKKWATHMTLVEKDGTFTITHEHVDGALWNAFMHGFQANRRVAK